MDGDPHEHRTALRIYAIYGGAVMLFRLAIAICIFGIDACQAQQLTITQSGTLPLDAVGYHIFTPTLGGVGSTGSCATKNYKTALGQLATCYVKVSDTFGDNTNCRAYSTYSDDDSIDIPCKTLIQATNLLPTKVAAPNWIVIRKGDTFTNQVLGTNSDMCVSGVSATQPFLVTTYPFGATGARPIIKTTNGLSMVGSGGGGGCGTWDDYLAFVGIEGYAYTRDPGNVGFVGPTANQFGFNMQNPFNWLLIEDCKVTFFVDGLLIQSSSVVNPSMNTSQTLLINSNLIMNNYDTHGHAQGAFIENVQNTIITRNVSDGNGYNRSVVGSDTDTLFNHNWYIAGDNGPIVFSGNISARASATGIQGRPGGMFNDNLFLANPQAMAAGASPNTISNNVVAEAANATLNPVQTSAATVSGNTLTFTAVPAGITLGFGMGAIDTDNGAVIPSSATVSSKTATTVVMSQSVAGVGSGDHIVFFFPRGDGITTSTNIVASTPTSAPSLLGDTALHFAGNAPDVTGGLAGVVDVTNPSAVASGTQATDPTGTRTNIVLSKALLANVPIGEIIQFPPIGQNNAPYYGTSTPSVLTNNIIKDRSSLTAPDFGVEWTAGTTGNTAGPSNITCGTNWTSNLYVDLGTSNTGSPTSQINNCNGIGPDPSNATIEAYDAAQGGAGTLINYLTQAELMSRDNFITGTFNPAYTAHQTNNAGFRLKLGVPLN